MNEQDREALALVKRGESACLTDDDDRDLHEATRHLECRLTHLDDLEKALAWREENRDAIRDYVAEYGYATRYWEHHDCTTQGRGEALVRLWKRVTGGE